MRFALMFPAIATLLALAACNANRAPPQVEFSPPPAISHVRATPPEERAASGCAGDIARFRSIQESELAAGQVDRGVYAQIQGEISEADNACKAGDSLRAQGLLRATKARHGYPAG